MYLTYKGWKINRGIGISILSFFICITTLFSVWTFTPISINKYDYKSEMYEIYKKADIVSLHIPLTEETTYLVNNNFINNFQKNFYLINTARGKCVNTRHLISALASGKVKGACLDVLEHDNKSI